MQVSTDKFLPGLTPPNTHAYHFDPSQKYFYLLTKCRCRYFYFFFSMTTVNKHLKCDVQFSKKSIQTDRKIKFDIKGFNFFPGPFDN